MTFIVENSYSNQFVDFTLKFIKIKKLFNYKLALLTKDIICLAQISHLNQKALKSIYTSIYHCGEEKCV